MKTTMHYRRQHALHALLPVLAAIGLGLYAQASGTRIGVNFVGGSAGYGEPAPLDFNNDYAGAVTHRFWNNASGASGSMSGLYGDDGSTQIAIYFSGVTVSWSAGAGIGSTPILDLGGNARMLKGFLQGDSTVGSITVSVSQVPATLTTLGYVVIAYCDADNGTVDRVAKISVSAPGAGMATAFVLDKANASFGGTFKQAPPSSTGDLGSATPDGNFVAFGPFYSTSFTLTVSGGNASDSTPRAGLNGIQLISLSLLTLPPAINLSSPANGTTIWACIPLLLTANASGNGRPVSKVEFFQGANLMATCVSAPYSASWKTDVLGTYAFTARATDSAGYAATTAPISVTVGLPPLHLLVPYGLLTNGQCEVCMQGESNKHYSILATTNAANWDASAVTNLGTMVNSNGLLIFRDPNSSRFTRRFYRALQQ